MTDIPGTGKLQEKKPQAKDEEIKTNSEPILITAINVKQTKKRNIKEIEYDSNKQKGLIKVLLISFSLSTLVFGILSLFVFQFIYLIPTGLIVGVIIYYVKNSLDKISKKQDDIIRNSLN